MPDDALTTSGSYPSFRLAMGSVLAARNDGIVLATSITTARSADDSLNARTSRPFVPGNCVAINRLTVSAIDPPMRKPIFYLLEKARDASFARNGVERLISVFGVAPIDEGVVRRALALGWPDFEDAVCAAAAEVLGCEAIVTRDPDGFPDSPVPVIDPAGALTWILGA